MHWWCVIGLGMVVGVASMVLMGVVEMVRKYDLSVHGGIEQDVGGVHYNASRVSLFWQTPQFLLAGVAESFTHVSGKPNNPPRCVLTVACGTNIAAALSPSTGRFSKSCKHGLFLGCK